MCTREISPYKHTHLNKSSIYTTIDYKSEATVDQWHIPACLSVCFYWRKKDSSFWIIPASTTVETDVLCYYQDNSGQSFSWNLSFLRKDNTAEIFRLTPTETHIIPADCAWKRYTMLRSDAIAWPFSGLFMKREDWTHAWVVHMPENSLR